MHTTYNMPLNAVQTGDS